MVERKVNNDEPPSDEAKVEAPPLLPDSDSDSVSVRIPNPPSAPGDPPMPAPPNNGNLHPVIRIMQEKELGKAVIAFAIPITMAIIMTVGMDKDAQSEMSFILILLCLGVAAILNGILLQEIFPQFAQIAEAVGIALAVTGFFVVIAVYLPALVSWVPAVCIGFCLVPFAIAVWQRPPN